MTDKEKEGFEEWFVANQAKLYSIGLRLTRNKEDAGDLVHDTLEKCLKYGGAIAKPQAFFLTVMKNLHLNKIGHAHRVQMTALEEEQTDDKLAEGPGLGVSWEKVQSAFRQKRNQRDAKILTDVERKLRRHVDARLIPLIVDLLRKRLRLNRKVTKLKEDKQVTWQMLMAESGRRRSQRTEAVLEEFEDSLKHIPTGTQSRIVLSVVAKCMNSQYRSRLFEPTEYLEAMGLMSPGTEILENIDDDLHRRLLRLSKRDRDIFVLCDVEKWKHEDVAAATEVSPETVKKSLQKIRRLIKKP